MVADQTDQETHLVEAVQHFMAQDNSRTLLPNACAEVLRTHVLDEETRTSLARRGLIARVAAALAA